MRNKAFYESLLKERDRNLHPGATFLNEIWLPKQKPIKPTKLLSLYNQQNVHYGKDMEEVILGQERISSNKVRLVIISPEIAAFRKTEVETDSFFRKMLQKGFKYPSLHAALLTPLHPDLASFIELHCVRFAREMPISNSDWKITYVGLSEGRKSIRQSPADWEKKTICNILWVFESPQ